MGIRDRIRTRYSTNGKKQFVYDLAKLGAIAALGYGVNDWRNRGLKIKELYGNLADCSEDSARGNAYRDFVVPLYNNGVSRPWGKAGSKFVKGVIGPVREQFDPYEKGMRNALPFKEDNIKKVLDNFGFGRRRRSTRRKSRKSCKGSKKSRKCKSFGRRRKSRKGSKKSRKSRRKSRKH